MSDPLIGRKLGDYTIQGLLGRGGMSRVYRGYDENLARYAAVKVISGDFLSTSEEEYTRRFQSEARAIAHLRHPNIVGIYQFGRSEGIYYMAQVLLEGKDLRTLLKSYADKGQRIPVPEILRIVRDVASALDYAHEQGVIHRDIKPSNIMLEKRTGRAILMDFGLALSIHEGTMGDTFGSAHYIAPEQAISSAKAVPQSDQYSLGIVIYEMLAGKVPFDDPSVMSVALKHLNELPPPPTLYNPDLPLEVEKVILRTLEKDPTRRYPTVLGMADALEVAFQQAAQRSATGSKPGLSVTDMLESRITPPGRQPAAPPPLSPASARPAPAATEPEEREGSLAGRFARRKARKEQEAISQSLDESELQIDEASLGSILDSYADPRDIGLVGPGAKGVVVSEKPAPAASARITPPVPSAPSAPAVEAPRKKRRSRTGLLLTLLLLIVIGGGAVVLGMGGGKDSASTLTDEQRSATAVALAAGTAGAESTESTAIGTEETDQATAAVSPVQTQTKVAALQDTPATSQPKRTARPSTATAVPSLTKTRSPTPVTESATPLSTEASTIVSTENGTEAAAGEITAAAEPTVTSRPSATATPASAGEPNLRMVYAGGQFLLVNLSDASLDVSRLIFRQERFDGVVLQFEAALWGEVAAEPPSEMGPGGCYQVLSSEADRVAPDRDMCPRFLGWFRSNAAERYFWMSTRPGETFEVYLGTSSDPLVTCMISAGECEFYLPE